MHYRHLVKIINLGTNGTITTTSNSNNNAPHPYLSDPSFSSSNLLLFAVAIQEILRWIN
ncbi:MAG TPA: hypothetical protein VFY68_10410 [Nitrososphaeraceae archaeon]|nr:hypothetical protein [Nitrososphaeraceae archaeon]